MAVAKNGGGSNVLMMDFEMDLMMDDGNVGATYPIGKFEDAVLVVDVNA